MKDHRRARYSNYWKIYKMKVWKLIILGVILELILWKKRYLKKTKNPRAQYHWVGRGNRPRRVERLLIFVLVMGAMAIFEPHEYIYWATLWGGAVSIFVSLYTLYILVPRKRHHWVK